MAQTSGSARGVLVLSKRLACTPLATPSTPVTHVIIPKIRLPEEKQEADFDLEELLENLFDGLSGLTVTSAARRFTHHIKQRETLRVANLLDNI